jgi:hypothetical protein
LNDDEMLAEMSHMLNSLLAHFAAGEKNAAVKKK